MSSENDTPNPPKNKPATMLFDEMGIMLKQLAALDQASNEEELNQAIPALLHSIGVLTKSDRAYVFEWTLGEKPRIDNAYEWYAPNAPERTSVIRAAFEESSDNLMEVFQRDKPLVIHDVASIARTRPAEHATLSALGIRSLVAFPMYAGNRLIGFSGVDNPMIGKSGDSLIVQLLSAVSGHLACLRDNMRTRELLRSSQRALTANLDIMEREKSLLDALSIDYTSIYACNLSRNVIEMRQEVTGSNAPIIDLELPSIANCYSERLRTYFERFVIEESCPDFLERLSAARLMRELECASRVAFRFKSKPNVQGHEHFEVQITRIRSTEDDFRVVMGFRYVDELVAEEEAQRNRLQQALDRAQLNYEIVSAISKIYWVIYRIDLQEDRFEEIAAGDEMHRVAGKGGRASTTIVDALPKIVSPESQPSMRVFMDISTLRERLAARETIASEYLAADGKWHEGRFIVKKRDAAGLPAVVLYASSIIDDQKRREFEYQRELKLAANEARRANAAKTDFLRRMSHDIRTPINGIRGMVNIAKASPRDFERLQECHDKIWDASSYLLSLVNSVLDMNKLESGNIMLESRPFNMHDMLREIKSVAEGQAAEHGVTFTLAVDDGAIKHDNLIGSPSHVNQILINLVSNGIKYNCMLGEVRLSCEELDTISETPSSEGDDKQESARFRFTCEDTGIGMSEEFQSRAFEPFTQEDRSEARTHYQGSGLGLSITKNLAEKMGGTIELESEEGRGTTFIVEIPLIIDESDKRCDADPLDRRAVAGMCVLLAEDNELNAEIAEFVLNSNGIDVRTVANGRDAVDVLEQTAPGTFDAVLMDIMMPIMNGLDAARRIRASKRADLRTIPIYAMSANAFTDDIDNSLKAGMNGHLTKPFEEEHIVAALASCRKGNAV